MSTVVVCDADGHEQVLYLGTVAGGKGEQHWWEMPPRPPSGVFDVRFTSDRLVEDPGNSIRSVFPVRISSAKYPVTVTCNFADARFIPSLIIGGREVKLSAGRAFVVTQETQYMQLVVQQKEPLPVSYSLDQNFPNPFNPLTTIRYALAADSWVTISIFNILGQQIATIADGIEQAGRKEIAWAPDGFASGTYFIRFHASQIKNPALTRTLVRKVLFLK
jgi:hypothetical protein